MKYCVHFILKDHKILLLKRALSNPFYPGIWTPVVGKIKSNEEPNHAIVRETIEETKLIQEKPQFLKRCEFDNDEYWLYHSRTIANNISLNHENDNFAFFEKNNLPENLWSFFKAEIKKLNLSS